MSQGGVAILLMAYGGASNLAEIPVYLKDILGGRPVPDALVHDVTERYRRIGGKSPLLEITQEQARALKDRLAAGNRSFRFDVFVGMRHSQPSIRSAVGKIVKLGHKTFVALPLTPYFSHMSVGAYMAKLKDAVSEAGNGLNVLRVESYNEHPGLIEAFAAKTRAALDKIPAGLKDSTALILSAHSLPSRIVSEGDPYSRQLEAAAKAVAEASGAKRWRFAYQSRGASAKEAWLGPDVAEILPELAREGAKAVVLAPIGFISDHLETLYDDDIIYREQAQTLGLHFVRAEALNADPAFIAVLADVVLARLKNS